MIPLDLEGKVALVTGVGDDFSFAWHIAKGLQAAGARLVLACNPWFISIVENILVHEGYADARVLPYGRGALAVEKVFPCDVLGPAHLRALRGPLPTPPDIVSGRADSSSGQLSR